METVSENLCGATKCMQIMDNDVFDIIYSILYYIEETPAQVRKEMIENLNKGLKQIIKGMDKNRILNVDAAFDHRKSIQSMTSSGGGRQSDINLYRNSLKAYVYLISWFLSENSKLKDSKENHTKTRKKAN